MKLFWQMYTWPKLFVPPRRPDVTKIVSAGRRFGKTRLTSIQISTLAGGEEGRKRAIEFWQKVDRGENTMKDCYKTIIDEERALFQHDIDECHKLCIWCQILYDLSRGKETLHTLEVKANNKLKGHCNKFQIMYYDCVHTILMQPTSYMNLSKVIQKEELNNAVNDIRNKKKDFKLYNSTHKRSQ